MNKQPMYTTTVNAMDKKIIWIRSPHFDTELYLYTYDSNNRLAKMVSKGKNGEIHSIQEITYQCNDNNDIVKEFQLHKSYFVEEPYEELRSNSFTIDYEYEYLPTGEKSKQIQKRNGDVLESRKYEYLDGRLHKVEIYPKRRHSKYCLPIIQLLDYSNSNFILKTVMFACDIISYHKMYFLDEGKIVSAIKLNPQKGKMRWSIDNVDIREELIIFTIYIFEDVLYPSFLIEILDYLLGLEHHGKQVYIIAYDVYTDCQFFPQNADIIEKYKEIYGINFDWTF
ncbi:MAG: hypothetical protein FWG64_12215 [Firmicutes bacterium]|nr:hypothetical protein [Bacillota bacterium]